MKTLLQTEPIQEIEVDALAVIAYDKESVAGGLGTGAAKLVNELTGGWVGELYSSGEFTGKLLETAQLYRPPNMKTRRLFIIGGGLPEKSTPAEIRKISGTVLRHAKSKGSRNIVLALDPNQATEEGIVAAIEGAVLGDFEPDRYKTDRKDEKVVDQFGLALPAVDRNIETGHARGRILAESQNYTRDLVSEPANRLTPLLLAEHAQRMAVEYGLECEVLSKEQMQQLGMGALLGVAQGSTQPPALIIVRYLPPATETKAHIGLLGKGVTFDSGGISIKPSEGMEKMKYDMAGGAAVLGAMRAVAQLRPPVCVTAVIPAVENMPGGRAQRPGDIVTTLSGKTVEVLNTDAEGRLILADALTYAQRLGCTHLVDVATLTGAIVVALGHVYIGVFGNDEQLTEKILAAAGAEGEKVWRMPLDDEYKEGLKSAFADIPNIANRWGGAITAAMFLKEFAGPTPWVHLDIAGTAWLEEAKPFMAKGPSGVTVRALARMVADWRD
jgi:leucyl aminopeptidase